MPTITIIELEATINRCAKARPPIDYVLGPDLRALANVYGDMIYRRLGSLELSTLPAARREVVERWLQMPQQGFCPAPGTDGCEACQ